MTRFSCCLIAALFAVSACGGGDEEKPAEPAAAVPAEKPAPKELKPAAGIEWHDGDVDDAFAVARASGKPIYLYWGAVWCPPCHAISATVFKDPEFIERSRLFVPVYLDGDTVNAQEAGERFGVRGYPTMIVFDSEGVELTRIPGGIDMQAYSNVLDLTLSNSSSSSDLLEKALSSGELTSEECTQLAFHSWGQDTTILEEHDEPAAFRSMFDACPANMSTERSRS